MANVSLPLDLALAEYWKVDMLSLFNLPFTGFWEISELLTVPPFVM
jgi:hypothetical protein